MPSTEQDCLTDKGESEQNAGSDNDCTNSDLETLLLGCATGNRQKNWCKANRVDGHKQGYKGIQQCINWQHDALSRSFLRLMARPETP